MSNNMAILIAISIYLLGFILIIVTIYLMEKNNKKKLESELTRLETLKNLIISSGILTEMEKVKALINSETLENMYKKWEKFMEEYIRKKQKKDRIKKYFIENH